MSSNNFGNLGDRRSQRDPTKDGALKARLADPIKTAAEDAAAAAEHAAWSAAWSAARAIVGDATDDATYVAYIAARTAAWSTARAAEINWQGRRLIDLTEAGVWTPVEEADKRGWSSYGH